MNEFMIRFASAENALEHMQQVESAIRSQSEEISKIRREFRADFRGKARILQNLYNQMNRMSGLGDSAKVFEDSLESILGIYNAVEQELLGQVEDTGRSGAAPSAVSSGGENASEKDREQDYIHNAGKRDEKRSLIPGASIIGAGTIGQYLLGDNQDPAGDPAGTQRAGGGEGQNANQAADGAGTSQAAPAVTDLDDLTAVLFPIPVDPDRIFKKEDPWEDFLHFLPAWLVEMLPDFALEYLHELFDLFRNLTELFGDVRFLDAEDILICGIWGTFYTLLIWYFYQKAFPQDGDTIETKSEDIRPIDESAEDGDPSEEEQELVDGPGDEESTTEEDSNSVEDKEQDGDTPEEQDSVEDQGQDEETSENKQDSAEDRGQDESTAEKDGGAAEENSGAGDPENSPLKTGDDTSDRGQQTNDSRGEAGKNTADPSSDNRGGNSADDSGAKNMPGKPASDPAGDSKAAKPVTDPAGAGDSTPSKPAADSAGDSAASKPAADPAGSSTVEKPATDPSIKSTTVKPIENPAAKSDAAKAAADRKAVSGTAKAAADPKAASGTAKTADTGAGKTSGSGKPSGGGGGKSSGGGGGKSSGGGGSGTDASYLPEDTAAEVADPGASDTTGDYLTSLLGEDSRNSTGISDWAKSTMDNWGQKAAEKLAESGAGEAAEKAAQTAAGIGGSPIGRTARSIVCAAVINAGIDMAMQGAGAVGSVLGGKDDLFKELGDSELV